MNNISLNVFQTFVDGYNKNTSGDKAVLRFADNEKTSLVVMTADDPSHSGCEKIPIASRNVSQNVSQQGEDAFAENLSRYQDNICLRGQLLTAVRSELGGETSEAFKEIEKLLFGDLQDFVRGDKTEKRFGITPGSTDLTVRVIQDVLKIVKANKNVNGKNNNSSGDIGQNKNLGQNNNLINVSNNNLIHDPNNNLINVSNNNVINVSNKNVIGKNEKEDDKEDDKEKKVSLSTSNKNGTNKTTEQKINSSLSKLSSGGQNKNLGQNNNLINVSNNNLIHDPTTNVVGNSKKKEEDTSEDKLLGGGNNGSTNSNKKEDDKVVSSAGNQNPALETEQNSGVSYVSFKNPFINLKKKGSGSSKGKLLGGGGQNKGSIPNKKGGRSLQKTSPSKVETISNTMNSDIDPKLLEDPKLLGEIKRLPGDKKQFICETFKVMCEKLDAQKARTKLAAVLPAVKKGLKHSSSIDPKLFAQLCELTDQYDFICEILNKLDENANKILKAYLQAVKKGVKHPSNIDRKLFAQLCELTDQCDFICEILNKLDENANKILKAYLQAVKDEEDEEEGGINPNVLADAFDLKGDQRQFICGILYNMRNKSNVQEAFKILVAYLPAAKNGLKLPSGINPELFAQVLELTTDQHEFIFEILSGMSDKFYGQEANDILKAYLEAVKNGANSAIDPNQLVQVFKLESDQSESICGILNDMHDKSDIREAFKILVAFLPAVNNEKLKLPSHIDPKLFVQVRELTIEQHEFIFKLLSGMSDKKMLDESDGQEANKILKAFLQAVKKGLKMPSHIDSKLFAQVCELTDQYEFIFGILNKLNDEDATKILKLYLQALKSLQNAQASQIAKKEEKKQTLSFSLKGLFNLNDDQRNFFRGILAARRDKTDVEEIFKILVAFLPAVKKGLKLPSGIDPNLFAQSHELTIEQHEFIFEILCGMSDKVKGQEANKILTALLPAVKGLKVPSLASDMMRLVVRGLPQDMEATKLSFLLYSCRHLYNCGPKNGREVSEEDVIHFFYLFNQIDNHNFVNLPIFPEKKTIAKVLIGKSNIEERLRQEIKFDSVDLEKGIGYDKMTNEEFAMIVDKFLVLTYAEEGANQETLEGSGNVNQSSVSGDEDAYKDAYEGLPQIPEGEDEGEGEGEGDVPDAPDMPVEEIVDVETNKPSTPTNKSINMLDEIKNFAKEKLKKVAGLVKISEEKPNSMKEHVEKMRLMAEEKIKKQTLEKQRKQQALSGMQKKMTTKQKTALQNVKNAMHNLQMERDNNDKKNKTILGNAMSNALRTRKAQLHRYDDDEDEEE